ncbi:MAG: M23 family metallopeptidase [Candidatus Pacebacteria bacterium]|jgi:murein DD-endopeptidase MepM/ murein hydrolase activator NlpD|nr:M23 family metallopeptidase [Candidatus Paceibacterota bacterium]MBT6401683.1 M23 family metallopeptidase [candidate division WWE3 bacterium]MBT7349577.1 M23 family metallopeptidase [candidate division WWE3 bacterium]
MNIYATVASLWSFKRELKLVLLSFLVVLSLPVIAVFILAHTGINVVSDALVGVDSETKNIQILDPATGEVVKEIDPTIAWPVQGIITLEFAQSSGYQVFHTGIDIANTLGTSITPFMQGEVVYAGEIFWGYGKHIIIEHGDNIRSIYAHLDKIYVFEGQKVNIGDEIGRMGSTGWSTGPHLHLEIRVYGIPVNPRVFLDG